MARRVKIPTPRFNLRAHDPQEDRDLPTLIVLVLRYSAGRLVWSTREKARPRFWNQKTGKVKVSLANPEDAHINTTLNNISNLAVEIFRKHEGNISIEDFKAELDYSTGRRKRDAGEEKHLPFLEFVNDYLNQRREASNAKRGTWKILQTCAAHLQSFADERRAGNLDYQDIDWNFRHQFEQWLYASPREHSTNYAAKMLSVVAQFLNQAKRKGYHTSDIHKMSGWNIKKEKTSNQVLSFDELEALHSLDLSSNPRLERIRDLFLFAAFSGLRFSDFTRITPEHIVEEDGEQVIEIFSQKTGEEVCIPLLPTLKEILEKYGYRSPGKISNQKFNDYIKEACKLAGIDQKVIHRQSKGGRIVEGTKAKYELIASHTGRRSFATNFYQLGIPVIELMKITGHATERQFMQYINIDKRANARSMAAKVAKLMGYGPLKAVKK